MEKINNAPLKDYTTYKLKGNVKAIYFPKNIDELKEVIKSNKKYKIIGNGSNLIISSKYDGVLIKLKNFDKLIFDDNKVIVGAGYMLSNLNTKCMEEGLTGLEFTFGIPATIGGAIYQNAGAFGFNISELVSNVSALDESFNIVNLSNKDILFGYRDSIFKHKNYIILEVTLNLKKETSKTIKENMFKYINLRKEKQPLEYPSAGSTFKNPIGHSAGFLIEKSNLKGYSVNDAFVSDKHANFIINKGEASGDDIIKLIKVIKKKVKEDSNISLELEQEILE